MVSASCNPHHLPRHQWLGLWIGSRRVLAATAADERTMTSLLPCWSCIGARCYNNSAQQNHRFLKSMETYENKQAKSFGWTQILDCVGSLFFIVFVWAWKLLVFSWTSLVSLGITFFWLETFFSVKLDYRHRSSCLPFDQFSCQANMTSLNLTNNFGEILCFAG